MLSRIGGMFGTTLTGSLFKNKNYRAYHAIQWANIFAMLGKMSTYLAAILEDTLFMVIADHGGTNDEKGKGSHGGWTDEEKYVTFAAVCKYINSGEIWKMNIRDLAAIVLYAMGIEAPAFNEKGWTSQIPYGLFKDYKGEYRDISHLIGAAPRISKKHHESELV